MTLFRYLVLCCLVVSAYDVSAARLDIPLRVSLDTLREALSTQLASYRDGPCRYLRLRPAQLQLQAEQGRLRLAVPGRGALGVPLSGQCQTAATWQGTMHFTLEPHIDSRGRLRVRIVDSRLGNARGGAAPVIWDLGKRHLHPQLERFSYDLGASREALSSLLRGAAAVHAPAMEQALQQLQVLQPQVERAHVMVPIALEIPDAWLAAPPAAASGAPLTEAELEALEKALEPWDAFLVYVLRQLALDGENSALRMRLFTLLLDSRYQLSALLAGDAVAQGDPVRALFLETWHELRAILVDARYAIFVDAADALAALETAAPGLPLSAEGLRQLARTLRPGDTSDPLAYDWALDRQLGELFEVDALPEAEPSPAPPPQRSWLDFFIAGAHADNAL